MNFGEGTLLPILNQFKLASIVLLCFRGVAFAGSTTTIRSYQANLPKKFQMRLFCSWEAASFFIGWCRRMERPGGSFLGICGRPNPLLSEASLVPTRGSGLKPFPLFSLGLKSNKNGCFDWIVPQLKNLTFFKNEL
ncbi:MAG: hypothetical protein KatS3mg096_808 [Candidatus Parcubacteria bacterium]|nr:MAG: hypothetical protein KatS3mg096_808 [Candidatus Parcubacteria bacterium]